MICISIISLIFEKIYGAVDAVPCRIAFERGKERNFSFLALSSSAGVSGWIVLAEESLLKPDHGTVRVTAPLAGCNVRTLLFNGTAL